MLRHRPELGRTLGEELLEPHLSYVSTVQRVRADVKSIAHVTGGGLVENLPRALPDGAAASLDRKAWDVPPIFSVIQSAGEIADDEMFRVFNMGLGMVLVCDGAKASALAAELPGAKIVGEVTAASGQPRVCCDRGVIAAHPYAPGHSRSRGFVRVSGPLGGCRTQR